MRFTHLHTHTHYSLLDGLSKIDDLVARVKELGMDSAAITDHGVLYGAVEFYKKAKAAGIKPIIGCEIYVSKNSMYEKRTGIDDERYHLVLLAKNQIGYQNLVKIVTTAHLEGFYYKPRADKDFLRKHSEGLICLSACLGGELSRAAAVDIERGKKVALEYQEIFGKDNYFIEIQQHPNIEEQNFVTGRLIEIARQTEIPIVATQDSHYLRHEDAEAHDILLAVQTNNRLDDKDRLTLKNDDFSLASAETMAEKFKLIPGITEKEAQAVINNTQLIADQCNVEIPLGKSVLPHFELPAGFNSNEEYLKHICYQNLPKRYPQQTQEILKRLEYELGVIAQTGFASYFLIVQDFVNWAKNNGIIVGPGRGSAAGSIVSYLLGITGIDPLKYDLLFERFLNPARISMPDIDLDFDDARRPEVLNYVAQKYGKDHVAQIITFGSMAARAAIRDTGRALGMAYDFCDMIAKLIPFNPIQGDKSAYLKRCLENVAELKQIYSTNPDAKKLIDSAMKLEGVVRHASTHACGVVITKDPLISYLPLQKGTQDEDSVITQYEMRAVEDMGLLKMDFLGLANLTIIENTLNLVEKNHSIKINIDDIPLDDPKTFELFQQAKTTGVFQLESNGMKRYLKQLKPTELEDIITMVSLYRPGPMELIPEYIERKYGRKKVEYLHPKLELILKKTYGIMIYQEQLIGAVRALAGFSLAEADVLRKAVGKKIKKLLDEQEAGFMTGAAKVETPPDIAKKFWALVEPFNRYGFPRSHAACYALIAYQTAYLKAHYPIEFMAALMNSHSGDIEKIAFLIDECNSMDIEVLAPDISESFEKFSIADNKIRFGLSAVKNVGINLIKTLIEERERRGKFKSIEDFIMRVKNKDLNKKSLESLIKCGALDAMGERNLYLTNVEQLLNYARESQKNYSAGQDSLFGSNSIELPSLRLASCAPATKNEKLNWEKELLGLFISDHPLRDYEDQISKIYQTEKIAQVVKQASSRGFNGRFIKIGGIVTKTQKVITKTGQPMFFSWLEDLTSKVEVVVFPKTVERDPGIWRENNILVVKGRVNERDGVPKIICEEVFPIATLS